MPAANVHKFVLYARVCPRELFIMYAGSRGVSDCGRSWFLETLYLYTLRFLNLYAHFVIIIIIIINIMVVGAQSTW